MIRKPFYKFLILVNLAVTAMLILAIAETPDPVCLDSYIQELQDNRVTIEETTDLYEQKLAELRTYETTEDDLIAIGANQEQATAIIKSSKLFHIDPKH